MVAGRHLGVSVSGSDPRTRLEGIRGGILHRDHGSDQLPHPRGAW